MSSPPENRRRMKQEPPETWVCPPVHPAAIKPWLPLMTDVELDVLAATIKRTGLIDPIVIWVDNAEEANGAEGPFPEFLLDGRNRLAALALLGITDPREAPVAGVLRHNGVRKVYAIQMVDLQWVTDTDPEDFVFAANNRRHLPPELKREMIADCIKKYPQASNREIARKVKADHKTVADVRKGTGPSGEAPQMGQGGGPTEVSPGGRSGDVPQVGQEHLPIERAKAAVRANPGASANRIAEAAKVGRATAQRAQHLVADESKAGVKPAPPKPAPKPAPVAKVTPEEIRRDLEEICINAQVIGISDEEILDIDKAALAARWK